MWSALNYHGLSDQIPSAVFICAPKAKKSIKVLNAEFIFVQLADRKFFGMEKVSVEGREVVVSDKPKTIVDCLDHPEHAGGIDELAKSIFFNHEELDFAKVRAYALKMANIAIFKRLGFILDMAGLLDKYSGVLEGIKLTKGYPVLDKLGPQKGRYSEKWKLFINADLNSKRWMY
jgi:predicted transcriptional regulator of viral defense system